MTAPREPGFYWVRFQTEEWTVGHIEDGAVRLFGRAIGYRIDDHRLTWGPRLEPPPATTP